MEETEKLRLMDEMGIFLQGAASAMHMPHNCIVRFSNLYQIINTGIDVVWEKNVSPTGEDGWVLKETYTEINLATDEETAHTETVVISELYEIAMMVKAAFLTIAERTLDSALADIIVD